MFNMYDILVRVTNCFQSEYATRYTKPFPRILSPKFLTWISRETGTQHEDVFHIICNVDIIVDYVHECMKLFFVPMGTSLLGLG